MNPDRHDGSGPAAAVKAARGLLAAVAAVVSLLVVIPVALVLLPLWGVAALTRRVAAWLEPATLDWRHLIRFEEQVGWMPRAEVAGHVTDLNGDTFHVTTDRRGWRKAADLEESDLVVLGDSYAFGFGVDDDAFFARRVSGHRVSTIGAPGYGLAQPVLWIERLANELRGKTLVWLVYVGNDFTETLLPAEDGHRSPFVAVRSDGRCELVTRHVSPEPWPFPDPRRGMDDYIDVCTPGRQSTRAFAACEYLLERGARVCDAAGAELIVMTVPDLSPAAREALERALDARSRPEDFDEDLPERRVAEICDRLGVRRIALRDHLGPEDYLERDFHWNRAGHLRLAALLAELPGPADSKTSDAPSRAAREAADVASPGHAGNRTVGAAASPSAGNA